MSRTRSELTGLAYIIENMQIIQENVTYSFGTEATTIALTSLPTVTWQEGRVASPASHTAR